MSKEIDNGGLVYPSEQHETNDGTWNQTYEPGLTLRDYLAAKATQGLLACPTTGNDAKLLSEASYEVADEMLKVRKESNGTQA